MTYYAALGINVSPKDIQRVQRDERDDWYDFSKSKMDDIEALAEFAEMVADMGCETFPSDPQRQQRIREMIDQWELNKEHRSEIMQRYYGDK